jgi:hypothetical protein
VTYTEDLNPSSNLSAILTGAADGVAGAGVPLGRTTLTAAFLRLTLAGVTVGGTARLPRASWMP